MNDRIRKAEAALEAYESLRNQNDIEYQALLAEVEEARKEYFDAWASPLVLQYRSPSVEKHYSFEIPEDFARGIERVKC